MCCVCFVLMILVEPSCVLCVDDTGGSILSAVLLMILVESSCVLCVNDIGGTILCVVLMILVKPYCV